MFLQRFFRHMCMSAKVPATVRLAKKGLIEDKCVVIGLQSTGEARTEEAVTKYVRTSSFCDVHCVYNSVWFVVFSFVFSMLFLSSFGIGS